MAKITGGQETAWVLLVSGTRGIYLAGVYEPRTYGLTSVQSTTE